MRSKKQTHPARKPRPTSPLGATTQAESLTFNHGAIAEHMSKQALSCHHAPLSDQAPISNHAQPNAHDSLSTALSTSLPFYEPQGTQQNTQQDALRAARISSTSSPPTYTSGPMTAVSPMARWYANLCPVACSAELQNYQITNGISGMVYMVETTQPVKADPATISDDPIAANLLSYALSATTTSAAPAAVSVADNKNNILTQGQMLWAPDKDRFIACQADEINTLNDVDIMDILPFAQLPSHARLLSEEASV